MHKPATQCKDKLSDKVEKAIIRKASYFKR